MPLDRADEDGLDIFLEGEKQLLLLKAYQYRRSRDCLLFTRANAKVLFV
jgi:hypothetical protein